MKTGGRRFALFNKKKLGSKKSLIRGSLVSWYVVRNENRRCVQRRKVPALI